MPQYYSEIQALKVQLQNEMNTGLIGSNCVAICEKLNKLYKSLSSQMRGIFNSQNIELIGRNITSDLKYDQFLTLPLKIRFVDCVFNIPTIPIKEGFLICLQRCKTPSYFFFKDLQVSAIELDTVTNLKCLKIENCYGISTLLVRAPELTEVSIKGTNFLKEFNIQKDGMKKISLVDVNLQNSKFCLGATDSIDLVRVSGHTMNLKTGQKGKYIIRQLRLSDSLYMNSPASGTKALISNSTIKSILFQGPSCFDATIINSHKIDSVQHHSYNQESSLKILRTPNVKSVHCGSLGELSLNGLIETDFYFFPSSKIGVVKVENSKMNFLNMSDVVFESQFTIHNCTLLESEFDRSTFRKMTVFMGCSFVQAPSFFDTSFSKNTIFGNCNFPDNGVLSEAKYRVLREYYKNNHDDVSDQLFAALELRSRGSRLSFKTDSLEKTLNYFSRWINFYGTDIARPFIILLLSIPFFGTLFIFSGGVVAAHSAIDVYGWEFDVLNASKCLQILYYSTINTLGPLRLLPSLSIVKADTFLVFVFSFLQGTLASVLWFLGITGIRRRFRH